MNSKKTTIYFILNHLGGGGAEIVTILLANFLSIRADYKITILVLDPRHDLLRLISKNVNVVSLNKRKHAIKAFKYFSAFFFLANINHSNSLAIVSSEGVSWVFGLFFPRRILWVHSNFKNYIKNHSLIYRLIFSNVLYFYKSLVCVSKDSLNSIKEVKKDIKFISSMVIYNPLRIQSIFRLKNPPNIEFPINIISVGRLDVSKQHDKTILILNKLRDLDINATLTIYGEGPERSNLENLICDLDLSNHVSLPGFCDEIKFRLSKAAFFISCSQSEGFGLSMIEAMAMGIPAIYLSPCPGLDEISSELKHAIPVSRYNYLLAADKVVELIRNPTLYTFQSNMSISRAQDFSGPDFYYNWNSLIMKTLH